MVCAWYLDNKDTDQRLPHKLEPNQPVSLDDLAKIRVLYFYFDVDESGDYAKEGSGFDQLKKSRGYSYQDVVMLTREKLPNYDEWMKKFFTEHLHEDEEIRFVLDGSGYLDVRDMEDRWIRIEVTKGDLLIIPAGIYHRFTLDMNNTMKAHRLFAGDPVWTAFFRPSDHMDCRIAYLKSIKG